MVNIDSLTIDWDIIVTKFKNIVSNVTHQRRIISYSDETLIDVILKILFNIVEVQRTLRYKLSNGVQMDEFNFQFRIQIKKL